MFNEETEIDPVFGIYCRPLCSLFVRFQRHRKNIIRNGVKSVRFR